MNNKASIPTFQCLMCSDCCTFTNPRDYPRVFPWEKRFLEEKARELNVKIVFEPELVYRDPLNNSYIVFLYKWIINGLCPFNRNGKCIIHGEHPLSCKMYPLIVNYSDRTLRISLQCIWVKEYFDIIKDTRDPSKIFPNEIGYAVKAYAYISLMIETAKNSGWERIDPRDIPRDSSTIDYDIYVKTIEKG